MKPFKEGDRVVCINAKGSHCLEVGKRYTVGRLLLFSDMIWIKELGYSYYGDWFVPACDFPTLRGGYGAV